MARKLYAHINQGDEPVLLERRLPDGPWVPAGVERLDVAAAGKGSFSVLLDGRSVRATVVKEDRASGTVKLRIGGKLYTVRVEDERARLVHALGLDKARSGAVPDLKAPMPGLVLSVLVKVGDVVKKNDALLVLEAMKMENVIKAPGDAVVAQVHAVQGKAVEKGALLLGFAPVS